MQFKKTPKFLHPGELQDPAYPIASSTGDYLTPVSFPAHSHPRAQLIYAAEGMLHVTTVDGTWLIPPQQAVWVPAGVKHEVNSAGPLSMRFLYIDAGATMDMRNYCCVLPVNRLLRELIIEVSSFVTDYNIDSPQYRLCQVTIDQLSSLEPAPLHLPLPADRRIKTVADRLIKHPGDNSGLRNWSEKVGASERTLARLFVEQTGMTFGHWRERVRLLAGISSLGSGKSVTEISYDLGYSSPSAFIAMFKRNMGVSPAQYIHH